MAEASGVGVIIDPKAIPIADAARRLSERDNRSPFEHAWSDGEDFELLLAAGLCDEEIESSDDQPSIAVLPFENMSGDPDQEYFSNGISDSIIGNLAFFCNPILPKRDPIAGGLFRRSA